MGEGGRQGKLSALHWAPEDTGLESRALKPAGQAWVQGWLHARWLWGSRTPPSLSLQVHRVEMGLPAWRWSLLIWRSRRR